MMRVNYVTQLFIPENIHHHHHHHHHYHDVDDVIEEDSPEEDLARTVGAGSKSTPGCPLPGVKFIIITIVIIIIIDIVIIVIIVVIVILTILITDIIKDYEQTITCGPCVTPEGAEWPYVQAPPALKFLSSTSTTTSLIFYDDIF